LSEVTPTLAVRSRLIFLFDYYRLPTSVEPLTPRLRGYAGPHQHARFIPLPQRICFVLAIASSTLLGPVSHGDRLTSFRQTATGGEKRRG